MNKIQKQLRLKTATENFLTASKVRYAANIANGLPALPTPAEILNLDELKQVLFYETKRTYDEALVELVTAASN